LKKEDNYQEKKNRGKKDARNKDDEDGIFRRERVEKYACAQRQF